jgi:hypothetical protein
LFEVTHTTRAPGVFPGARKDRKEDGSEYSYNSYNDKKFYEGEAPAVAGDIYSRHGEYSFK